ncbi:hypothetical protein CKAH01_16824 [Colletotrichum kahawae]|uniref:Chromo domain-containing protein n=1 Tax=Colletotrichum kahawae TaxID=34407 RepID=A0AAD9YCV4_COLKA|nr:hypothetical protein CKAH01_16824 [Colletotrichum kahawae]
METQPVYRTNNEGEASTMEWQVRTIQGHREIHGVIHYDVAWEPTWESGRRLQHMAKEIIAWNKRHDNSYYKRQSFHQFDPILKHWSGEIIGRDERDGQTYYEIEWQITTEPEANLENANGLLSEYWRRHRTESTASVNGGNGISS